MKVTMNCGVCGGTHVFRDAWAEWDDNKQEWVLQNVFDYAYCEDCEQDTHIVEKEME